MRAHPRILRLYALLSISILCTALLQLYLPILLSPSPSPCYSCFEQSTTSPSVNDRHRRMMILPNNKKHAKRVGWQSQNSLVQSSSSAPHIDHEARQFLNIRSFFRGDEVLSDGTSTADADSSRSTSITAATQLSVNPTKLQRLIDLASRWDKGYISVAVYARGNNSATEDLHSFFSGNPSVFKNTFVILVTDTRAEEEEQKTFYPINILRNIAIEYAPTDRVLLLDVDFIPSVGAHSKLMKHLSSFTTRDQTALIIPAFERRLNEGEEESSSAESFKLPPSKDDLIHALDTHPGEYEPFRPNNFPSHGPTNYEKWYSATEPYSLYQVDYSTRFEPYFVVNKGPRLPQFWEYFRGYGFNKFSWVAELSFAGYTFEVAPDCFLMHINHSYDKQDPRALRPEMVEEFAIRFNKHLRDTYGKSIWRSANYDWAQLPEKAKAAAELLGFDQRAWDADEDIPAYDKSILDADEVEAVEFLGLQDFFRSYGRSVSASRLAATSANGPNRTKDSLQGAGIRPASHSSAIPASYTKFDMRESAELEMMQNFLRDCIGAGLSQPSKTSPIYSPLAEDRFEWRRNGACRALAEHPVLLDAARRTLGLSHNAPLWLLAVGMRKKEEGSVHRLHSDMEFTSAGSWPLGGATLWMMINRDCGGPSPFTLLGGSHMLSHTAHEELKRRKCWSPPYKPLPCNVTEIFNELTAKHTYIEPVEGPTMPFMGIAWPSTAWHMTQDPCRREAVFIKYVSSLEAARAIVHKVPMDDIGVFRHLADRAPFVLVGATSDMEEDGDPLDHLHRFPFVASNDSRCKSNFRDGVVHAERFREDDVNAYWADLPEKARAAATLLGFDENSWDADETISLYSKTLEELREEERNAVFALRLEKMLFTCSSDARCNFPDAPELKQGKLVRPNEIHISGPYVANIKAMSHIGYSKKPRDKWLHTDKFSVQALATVYESTKFREIAHRPHLEQTLEICAIVSGRINYAAASACDEYFDVVSMDTYKVGILFPGIIHTASPDRWEDGQHMCFKIIPNNHTAYDHTRDWPQAVSASRVATKAFRVNLEHHFAENRALEIFMSKRPQAVYPPGYDRLHVKLVRYKDQEMTSNHIDKYDLIALVLSGTLQISSSGNSTALVPEQQFALLPAGTEHGFYAPSGPCMVVFIELE